MSLIVDGAHLGTSDADWLSADRFETMKPLRPRPPARLVIVSPHPDDETFGAGALIQVRGGGDEVPVNVICVTDGDGSHPLAVADGLDMRTIRRGEQQRALSRLGVREPLLNRLALPDGQVNLHVDELAGRLADALGPDDVCVAPWWRDGHPDHDACGQAARLATQATGTLLLAYLVWTWHWAGPAGSDLPWSDCRLLPLDRPEAARKRWASGAFVSQIRPLGPDRDEEPLLPSAVLRRFWRPFEVFIEDQEA
ncbi:MAG TPA: PIG-L family deacetylase [Acidimicrobiales bacterium]|jgi:LmbE family N-acetylglucosaminyl deacetylase